MIISANISPYFIKYQQKCKLQTRSHNDGPNFRSADIPTFRKYRIDLKKTNVGLSVGF